MIRRIRAASFVLFVLAISIVVIVGCGKKEPVSIRMSKEFWEWIDRDPEDYMEVWKKDVSDTEELGYLSYDLENGSVVVELTNEQLKNALALQESFIKDHQKKFVSNDNRYKIECSPDYKTIAYYVDWDLDAETFSLSLQLMGNRCATYRVFSGYEDDFIPIVQIYNCDTKKLVTESDKNGKLECTEEDWINSAK